MIGHRTATPEDAERLEYAGFAPIIGQITNRELTQLHQMITCSCGPACPRPGYHPRAHTWSSTAEALRRQLSGSNLLCDPARLGLVIVKPITDEGRAGILGTPVDREEFHAPCWEIPIGEFKGWYHVFRGQPPATTIEVMGLLIIGRDHPPFPLPPSDLGQEPSVVERIREGQNVFMRAREGHLYTVTWGRSPWGNSKPMELPTAVAEALVKAEQVAKPEATNVIEFPRASRKRS